jgi:hypothetical protein
MATGLKHIQEFEVDKAVLNQFCNSFSISVLTIDYCIDLSGPAVSFTVSLAGIKIGGGVIDPNNPSITIGGGAFGFKAEVTLTADFSNSKIDYKIEICAPIAGCKDYSGTLFSW